MGCLIIRSETAGMNRHVDLKELSYHLLDPLMDLKKRFILFIEFIFWILRDLNPKF